MLSLILKQLSSNLLRLVNMMLPMYFFSPNMTILNILFGESAVDAVFACPFV